MSDDLPHDNSRRGDPRSQHERLLRMDLATEILEGLDELGLDTRVQVAELLAKLERELEDAS